MLNKPLKTLFIAFVLLFLLFSVRGASFEEFTAAMWQVETGKREGMILGDDGASLGPLQIQYDYFLDSRVKGDYLSCTNYTFSCVVVKNYLQRYVPNALRACDWETCARVHNGGPKGANKKSTLPYWKKVKKKLDAAKKKL